MKYGYQTEIGIFKKQINNLENPIKNHPIHDAVDKISYANGRYHVVVVLDGVSESKSQKKLVPIGRMLSWDLARFCQEESPTNIKDLIAWFAATTTDERYQGKGNTTVALMRLDRATGKVDGFSAGDSVSLLALDRLRPDESGEPVLRCLAEVVAPLHCVANYPGVIYNGWRFNVPFKPDRFRFQLPEDWVNAYLVVMSDGYGKITDEVANQIYDYNEADQILAQRFPDFARVYLPSTLTHLAPEVYRSPDGRVLQAAIARNEELWQAISDYYDQEATDEERQELEVIDLDCAGLRRLIKQPDIVQINGKKADELIEGSHKSLQWMIGAQYMDAEDETGLEEYLRQYVMAELFAEAMVSEMYDAARRAEPLHTRLHTFGESLGPIGDDFAAAVMRIWRADED